MTNAAMPRTSAYYVAGSTELATETPLTLKKLEARRILTKTSTRLVIALVGLPARGKSFVARKMDHYLNWSGVQCKIFNVGSYRRQAYANLHKSTSPNAYSERDQKGACDADFFDANNKAATTLREQVAEMALRDMLRWLDEVEDDDGDYSNHYGNTNSYRQNERIAIFDATNSTNKRRQWILEECTSPQKRQGKTTGVVFVESICDDKELLMENYNFKVSNSPDFEGMTFEASMEDLMKRVRKYEEQYETITDDSLSYIKVFNLSTKLLVNHIYGRIAKYLVPALMAWHIGSRPIYLVRPGETESGISTDGEDYVYHRSNSSIDTKDPQYLDMSTRTRKRIMRGDTLGPTGKKFKAELLEFLIDEVKNFLLRRASVQDQIDTGTSISGIEKVRYNYSPDDSNASEPEGFVDSWSFPLRVLTSTMPRALDTVRWNDTRNISITQMSNLNPLDKGDYVGMELEEIAEINPKFYQRLEADPYGTRFPGGECYSDLIRRLATIVIDMEQQVIPTLVVSHVSILQCLMAYFRNTPVESCMSIEVPMHTVIKFEPVRGGGFRETQHSFCGEPFLGRKESDDSNSLRTHQRNGSARSLPIWGDHI
ncbi:hypothetical protein ACA910_004149 [Epithemia clementina (nom. ined.)]